MTGSVLAVFVEPAHYRIGLVRELHALWKGKLDIFYIGRNLSQVWGEDTEAGRVNYLPPTKSSALRALNARIGRANYDLVHVAGWGHPVLTGAIMLSGLRGLPIVSETDTQLPAAEPMLRRAIKRVLYPTCCFRFRRCFCPPGHARLPISRSTM